MKVKKTSLSLPHLGFPLHSDYSKFHFPHRADTINKYVTGNWDTSSATAAVHTRNSQCEIRFGRRSRTDIRPRDAEPFRVTPVTRQPSSDLTYLTRFGKKHLFPTCRMRGIATYITIQIRSFLCLRAWIAVGLHAHVQILKSVKWIYFELMPEEIRNYVYPMCFRNWSILIRGLGLENPVRIDNYKVGQEGFPLFLLLVLRFWTDPFDRQIFSVQFVDGSTTTRW